jgi:GntR family transcriptional regulator
MVGRGSFVADLSANELMDKRSEMFIEKLKKDMAYYKSLGVTLEEIIEAVRKYYMV